MLRQVYNDSPTTLHRHNEELKPWGFAEDYEWMDLGPQWQAPDHAEVDSLEKHVELTFEQATDPTREPVANEANTNYWMSEPEGALAVLLPAGFGAAWSRRHCSSSMVVTGVCPAQEQDVTSVGSRSCVLFLMVQPAILHSLAHRCVCQVATWSLCAVTTLHVMLGRPCALPAARPASDSMSRCCHPGCLHAAPAEDE